MTNDSIATGGGFVGDPVEAFSPPSAGSCCGSVASKDTDTGGCCGTDTKVTANTCCGSEPAVTSTGCCG